MAKKGQQTEKSCYPSKYSPGAFITEAQYILEIVCEKKAEFDKTHLPIKFWNLPEWRQFYMKNLRQVHKLLKIYNVHVILNTLADLQMGNKYSIFTTFFLELLDKHKILYRDTHLISSLQTIKRSESPSKPRDISSNNIIDTLKNLDK